MEEFESILRLHRERYPLMEPQDYGKLAFQSEFGPEHMVGDPAAVLDRLERERRELPEAYTAIAPEPIGNGLCRIHLAACTMEQMSALAEMFCRCAKLHRGSMAGLEARFALMGELEIPGLKQWLERYSAAGCPPVRHSPVFREHYAPHYRVIRLEDADYFFHAGTTC